jgi:hypothetical protein
MVKHKMSAAEWLKSAAHVKHGMTEPVLLRLYHSVAATPLIWKTDTLALSGWLDVSDGSRSWTLLTPNFAKRWAVINADTAQLALYASASTAEPPVEVLDLDLTRSKPPAPSSAAPSASATVASTASAAMTMLSAGVASVAASVGISSGGGSSGGEGKTIATPARAPVFALTLEADTAFGPKPTPPFAFGIGYHGAERHGLRRFARYFPKQPLPAQHSE